MDNTNKERITFFTNPDVKKRFKAALALEGKKFNQWFEEKALETIKTVNNSPSNDASNL